MPVPAAAERECPRENSGTVDGAGGLWRRRRQGTVAATTARCWRTRLRANPFPARRRRPVMVQFPEALVVPPSGAIPLTTGTWCADGTTSGSGGASTIGPGIAPSPRSVASGRGGIGVPNSAASFSSTLPAPCFTLHVEVDAPNSATASCSSPRESGTARPPRSTSSSQGTSSSRWRQARASRPTNGRASASAATQQARKAADSSGRR